ncbi:polar amino acid transport system substrate-binding protein [Erwinia toletana]|uniref:Polar amino acid transport system substrate-binding protein n=1 Tax=Winslowiella toletana TaxID=92490 RepID=A0ABS4PB88_9GAMM|nr:ABC transporter substrate-binding protein [Winslowiella toletana]MBP2169346.1 polar amino acid transport system substrate-binding protein [Winslowiella toletana]
MRYFLKHLAILCGCMMAIFPGLSSAKDLIVGGYPSYPPVEMRDPATGKSVGFDIDFAAELAQEMGVKITFSETAFAQLIPSLQTGRLDFFLSAMSDTAERQKHLTFVDYLRSGTQLMVLSSAADQGKTLKDYCGKKIAASRATNIIAQLNEWSDKHCTSAGLSKMNVVGAENNIDARMQLKQNRVDAMAQDSLTIPYIQQIEKGVFTTVDQPINFSYMGMGVSSDNVPLQKSLQQALQKMIDNGRYAALLKKWNLPAVSAVPAALINSKPASAL